MKGIVCSSTQPEMIIRAGRRWDDGDGVLVMAGGGMVIDVMCQISISVRKLFAVFRALRVGRSLFMLPFWEDEFLVLIPT